MHPDAIIAGLRRELDRLDKSADDYADRKKAIEAEITTTDGLDRPEVAPEQPDTVVDQNVGYLKGLYLELKRAAEERAGEIRAEIKRVEALVHGKAAAKDDEAPGDDLEKRSRDELNELASGLGVEDPDKLPNKEAVVDAIRNASGGSAGE